MAFKRNQFALRVTGFQVTPDEQDSYDLYTIVNPATTALGTLWVASAGTAGTSANNALVINNKQPDYPRNVAFNIHGTGANMAGTLTINGFDQFGSPVTETMSIGTNNNGGTTVGTKVFASFTSGTVNFGTAVGNGTPNIGLDGGTSALFGLPVKIKSTSDVVFMSMNAGTGPISVGGGTAIGSLISTQYHAVRPFATLNGTSCINVWINSTYNAENEGPIANLKQPS